MVAPAVFVTTSPLPYNSTAVLNGELIAPLFVTVLPSPRMNMVTLPLVMDAPAAFDTALDPPKS
jgi:hypothetical protein